VTPAPNFFQAARVSTILSICSDRKFVWSAETRQRDVLGTQLERMRLSCSSLSMYCSRFFRLIL